MYTLLLKHRVRCKFHPGRVVLELRRIQNFPPLSPHHGRCSSVIKLRKLVPPKKLCVRHWLKKISLKVYHRNFSCEETQIMIFIRPKSRFRINRYTSYSDNRWSGVVNTYIFLSVLITMGISFKVKVLSVSCFQNP